jgi:hypothetical protein
MATPRRPPLSLAIPSRSISSSIRNAWTAIVTPIKRSGRLERFSFEDSWIDVLAPIPFLFWYLGIFRPMNRYGELRNDRLAALEELLSLRVPDLDMRHFRQFSSVRKRESLWVRLVKLKWLWQPRVVEVVTLFGVSVLVLELYLVWKRILAPPIRSLIAL